MSISITTVVRDFLTDPSIEEIEIVGDSFRRSLKMSKLNYVVCNEEAIYISEHTDDHFCERVIGPDDAIKTLREFADMEVVSYDKVPIQWIVGEGGRKIIKKWRYILYV